MKYSLHGFGSSVTNRNSVHGQNPTIFSSLREGAFWAACICYLCSGVYHLITGFETPPAAPQRTILWDSTGFHYDELPQSESGSESMSRTNRVILYNELKEDCVLQLVQGWFWQYSINPTFFWVPTSLFISSHDTQMQFPLIYPVM